MEVERKRVFEATVADSRGWNFTNNVKLKVGLDSIRNNSLASKTSKNFNFEISPPNETALSVEPSINVAIPGH